MLFDTIIISNSIVITAMSVVMIIVTATSSSTTSIGTSTAREKRPPCGPMKRAGIACGSGGGLQGAIERFAVEDHFP
jgi:hypothetical protein